MSQRSTNITKAVAQPTPPSQDELSLLLGELQNS
jgi:hypothetical protein